MKAKDPFSGICAQNSIIYEKGRDCLCERGWETRERKEKSTERKNVKRRLKNRPEKKENSSKVGYLKSKS